MQQSRYKSVAESFEQEKKTYIDYLQELAIRELEHIANTEMFLPQIRKNLGIDQ
ncbi:hypothetical protein [Rickettsia endosymbiont of Urophora cardui]|uniref:hypothetical protein n=1 Tax=Rickettsia endosymbiont of Urophora cardui TaxID=3066265 RepID=UPI00313B190F